MAKSKKMTGRPKKGEERGKTANVTIRMEPGLRQRLESAMARGGVPTMTEEVERRLEQAFSLDAERAAIEEEKAAIYNSFKGRDNYARCRLFADLMDEVAVATGRPWAEDPWAYDQVAAGIAHLLAALRPAGEAARPASIKGYPDDLVDRLGVSLAARQVMRLELSLPDVRTVDTKVRRCARIKGDLGPAGRKAVD